MVLPLIYTDGVHVVSDTSEDELHDWAYKAGIKRCWFHRGSLHPHYDIPKSLRGTVAFPGVQVVDSRKIVEILNGRGLGIRPRMKK
jgi:hypothetical protein